ncbi:MAG: DUF5658 family protein [Thermodesulfobacteriota bacterium]|nr:DUF5658 family protein [Thermodesulfobacteriota bacterium]
MPASGHRQLVSDRKVTGTECPPACERARRFHCPWCWLIGRAGERDGGAPTVKACFLRRHSPKIFAAIMGVILLSVVDGVLTLFLVSCGAREINPVMAYFLDHGPLVFFWAKYLLTCIPLVFILVHRGVTLFGTGVKAQALILWIAIPFALVVYWELYLVFCVV